MRHLLKGLRKTGIPFIDDIPWGTHISAFYENENDLIELLVSFFKAGLENNEYCMWIVCDPITVEEATKYLSNAIPNFNFYSSQIEILPHSEWYLKYGNFQGEKVLDSWVNKTNYAQSQGYDGLRISGNTTWLTNRYWKSFIDYEAEIEKRIGSLKLITLCTYKLSMCGYHQILDIVNNHQFSFIKSKFDWKYIKNNITNFNRINLIGKLAASIAHEIRNPITTVRGFIQLLQSKDEFSSYNDYFNIMVEELDRANLIISDYLSLSKRQVKNIQKHNLNNILISLLPLLQAVAIKESKDILLDTGDIVDIPVDINDNGLESMNSGGVLEIRTYMEKKAVALEIKDSGSGIAQEIINNLGTPFLTTKENGTGLGLYVTIKILDSYNAKINVKSSPIGTIFTILFPFDQDQCLKTKQVEEKIS